jgi:subtilisin family serine protease
MPVKVAIVDSGLGAGLDAAVSDRVAIRLADDGRVQCLPADANDALGHGSAVATLVLAGAPHCALLSVQVFDTARAASVLAIAAAIDWAVGEGARVINLSLGLRDDRRVLRDSCCAAMAQGVLLVASHPARGGVAFPAAYSGTLAVHGDSRCGDGDCSSVLDDVLFGASPRPPAGFAGGGASFATARVSGLAAAFFDANPAASAADFRSFLFATARFHGRERRSAAA